MERTTWITSNGNAKVVTICGPNVLYLQKKQTNNKPIKQMEVEVENNANREI